MKKYICFIVCILLCLSVCFVACDNDNSSDGIVRPPSSSSGNKNNSGNKDSVPTVSNKNDNTSNKKYDKKVALTLDDGPHNVRTTAIVDELDKYGYNATFFVVGNRIDGTEYNGAATLKYAYEHGNEIGIHGYTHGRYYDSCSDAEYKVELSYTENAIKEQIPKCTVKTLRPVGGKITDERIQTNKYSVIMWSIDSEDWKYKYATSGTEENNEKLDIIVNNVMSKVKDGDIILMHDIYQSTVDAVVEILKQLNEQGYDVVTVSELLGKKMSAGKSYTRLLADAAAESLMSAEHSMLCTNTKKNFDVTC